MYLQPILKWVGGKRQLLDVIVPLINRYQFDTYVEPFVGGGAVLFALSPQNAYINDVNPELINLYNIIKSSPQALIDALAKHDSNNSKDYYDLIRALDRTDEYKKLTDIDKAARMIYLNKTCFNGLYRVK